MPIILDWVFSKARRYFNDIIVSDILVMQIIREYMVSGLDYVNGFAVHGRI